MPAYCEVALPVPLDRTFTYAVRDGPAGAARRARHRALSQRKADRRGHRDWRRCAAAISRSSISKRCSTNEPLLERTSAEARRVDCAVLPRAAGRGAARHAAAHGRGAAHGLLPHHRSRARCAGRRARMAIPGRPESSAARTKRREGSCIQTSRTWSARVLERLASRRAGQGLHAAHRHCRHACRCWPACCARNGSRARPRPSSAMRAAPSASPC